MHADEQSRFDTLYQRHLRALKLQGLSAKTIDVYARAVRRVAERFDCCPDRLTVAQLEAHFSALVDSHSWSTVKVDRNGLQFFWRHVLKKDWDWVAIVRAPKIRSLPDILTRDEIRQLIAATDRLRYRVYVLATYSVGLRLGETLALQVGDIDTGRGRVHIRRGKGHRDRFVPLPAATATGLRGLAWRHQRTVFDALMRVAASTLRDFARNPAKLGGEPGLTTVLHTHARNLDFHPHCHVIVPGGAVDTGRRQWRTAKGRYLFNGFALARVFRARMLQALNEAGLAPPAGLPDQWVVHCKRVGRGAPALEYLARYLYRGVIGEASILDDRDGQITFRYTDGRTGERRTRTLPGEDFLHLVLQHVLPRRFRRVRDYGFLHGNARRVLTLVQRVLCVRLPAPEARRRPVMICPECLGPMHVIAVYRPPPRPG